MICDDVIAVGVVTESMFRRSDAEFLFSQFAAILGIRPHEGKAQPNRTPSARVDPTSKREFAVHGLPSSITSTLPCSLCTAQVVFGFVALPDSGVLCEVSKDFREAADEDGLWRAAYMERFEKPSGVNSTASPSGDEEDRWSVLVAHKGGGTGTARRRCGIPGGFKRRYMRRIQDPQVDLL